MIDDAKFEQLIEDSFDEVNNGVEGVQYMTAYKWAARAVAAKFLGKDQHEITEYSHEALEHAALVDDEKVLKHIRTIFKQLQITT